MFCIAPIIALSAAGLQARRAASIRTSSRLWRGNLPQTNPPPSANLLKSQIPLHGPTPALYASVQFLKLTPAAALPLLLLAYQQGPDAGVSGVPGETTCTSCHSGSGGTGNVAVTFPGGLAYTPGGKQHLVVTITDSAQRRWGFQLTARQSGGNTTQAGTFTPGSDGYTQIVCAPTNFRTENFGGACSNTTTYPLQYIEHTQAGTRLGQTGSAQFQFDWTPPASSIGNIVIYVAGNAANGDGTERGDHIYTQKYTLTPAPTTPMPSITAGGVVNAASFQGSIAAGGFVTIQGTNLAGSTRGWGTADIVNGALPTQLDNVSVTIDNKPAYVAYVSPTQINVQAPADSALGPVPVSVTYNGNTSQPGSTQLLSAAPAFFLWNGKYTVATRADYSLVGPANLFQGVTTVPARPGDVVILWGTGFGATTPNVAPGTVPSSDQIASVANAVTVTIGGLPAIVVGAALAPGNAGLYQVALQVPAGLPDGDQAVVAQVAGNTSPDGVLLTVQK